MQNHELTLEDVTAALGYIPATDRDTWVSMGMAVKSEFGEEGFGVWDAWSQESESYKTGDAVSVWKSIRPGGKVTLGTLIYAARQNGYEFKPEELTPEEKNRRIEAARERRRQLEEAMQADEAERQAWRDRVSATAVAIDGMLDKSGGSDYLERKWVKAFGLGFVHYGFLVVTRIAEKRIELITGKAEVGVFFDCVKRGEIDKSEVTFQYFKRGTIAVPMRAIDGRLWGWQFITAGGTKTFLKYGRKQGLFHLITAPGYDERNPSKERPAGHLIDPAPDIIAVVEGYSTGATIRQATGWVVAIAFDAGNLQPVAVALKAAYPNSRLLICGDDDRDSEGNPGRTKATAAGKAVEGAAVFPDFSRYEQGAGA